MTLEREHPSSSAIQRQAEQQIVDDIAKQLRRRLILHPPPIELSGGVRIEVDAATEDHSIVVDAYARQGKLKGAQPKKIAQDILKFALLKRERDYANTRTIIAFASSEARSSVSGWLKQAAIAFGVELMTSEIPKTLCDQILKAQSRQLMVNQDQLADDLEVQDQ